ncbi:hypothetical protein SAMN05444166_8229 [Singulisphaera sp. GP187]|nr:hypothetical protein SAMN05444166_8229 [Singulisphaera sp. GP187]
MPLPQYPIRSMRSRDLLSIIIAASLCTIGVSIRLLGCPPGTGDHGNRTATAGRLA